ncbi:MAG: hypothetical protein AAFY72_19215 [Cyanobacteria bacterium J06649_4]
MLKRRHPHPDCRFGRRCSNAGVRIQIVDSAGGAQTQMSASRFEIVGRCSNASVRIQIVDSAGDVQTQASASRFEIVEQCPKVERPPHD